LHSTKLKITWHEFLAADQVCQTVPLKYIWLDLDNFIMIWITLANSGSPGKMAVKTECVCVCVCVYGRG